MYSKYKMKIPTPVKTPPPLLPLYTLGFHIIAHVFICRLINFYLEYHGIECGTRCTQM